MQVSKVGLPMVSLQPLQQTTFWTSLATPHTVPVVAHTRQVLGTPRQLLVGFWQQLGALAPEQSWPSGVH